MDAEQRAWLAGAAQEKPIQWPVVCRRDLLFLIGTVVFVSGALAAMGAVISGRTGGSPLVWMPFAWIIGVCHIAPRTHTWHIVAAGILAVLVGHSAVSGPAADFTRSAGYALLPVPAVLMMRLFILSNHTSALIRFAVFVGVLVLLAPLTGGLLFAAVSFIRTGNPIAVVMSDGLNLAVACSVAVITLVPVFISRIAWNVLLARQAEAVTIITLTTVCVFFVSSSGTVWVLLMLPVLATIASLRFGLMGTGMTCTVIVIVTGWQTAHGHGPFVVLAAGPLAGMDTVLVQFLCFALAFVCCLIGSQAEDAERRNIGLRAYGDAVMGTPDGIAVLDSGGRILLANPAVSRITGRSARDLIGHDARKILHGTDDLYPQFDARLSNGEDSFQVSATVGLMDRQDAGAVFNATPLLNDGALVGIVLVMRDSTEQERLQTEFSETLAMTRALVQAVDHSVIGVDASGKVNHWNNAATEQFGIDARNAIGMDITELPGPDADERMGRYRHVMAGGRVEGLTITVPDRQGGEKLLDVTINPVVDDFGQVIGTATVSRDVTKIRASEKEAAETRDALADALGGIMDGVAFFDQDDRLTVCNDAFSKGFEPYIDVRSGEWSYEEIVTRIIDAETYEPDNKNDAAWMKAHLTRREMESLNPSGGVSEEFHLKNGRWYLASSYARRDNGMLFVIRDITALKKRELELRESNRDLEQFAHVASHDLKEPLRKIQTFGAILQADHIDELGTEAREIIGYMTDGADRLGRLVDDLLELSLVNHRSDELENVNLNESLDAVCETLSENIRDARASVTYGVLPEVCGRTIALDRVFANLIVNSIKYRDPGRPLEISITEIATSPGWVTIRVSDNGLGFDPGYADRIFHPFVRLKNDPGIAGTGLGLAIVRKIIQGFDGKIEARSEKGEGTRFLITLRRPTDRSS